jgi:TM2 domain-containing membrane protein YozV
MGQSADNVKQVSGTTEHGFVFHINELTINQNQEKDKKEEKKDDGKKPETKEKKDKKVNARNKYVAMVLAFFLGRFGIHKFYLGKPSLGFIYFLFSRYEFMLIVGLIDAVIYFYTDEDTWVKLYKY